MSIISCRDLYYTFGTSSKNYKEVHNFRISLDEKMKCNLKCILLYTTYTTYLQLYKN